jgi:hypothetical protein
LSKSLEADRGGFVVMPFSVFDPRDVIAIHDAAIGYVVKVQGASFQKAEQEQSDLVATSALSVLSHEMVCLHRAIKDLSLAGWAFAAPILLRSMVDAMCSIAVIANSDRPDVAAFKYFYTFTKDFLHDPTRAPDVVAAKEAPIRAELEASIIEHMAQMTEGDQQAASNFQKQPPAGYYWYSDLFRGPTEIIKQFFSSDMLHTYKYLSLSTHAAFIGMRLFRDDPGLQDINPRKDPGAAGFAMIGSSRMLLESSRAIVLFRGLGDLGHDAVLKAMRDCRRLI